jgi:hypothetical protein
MICSAQLPTKGLSMGTNYYLHQKPDRECCGRSFEPLHIGKSSGGWCFTLHVMPEDNINTLDDWRNLWAAPGAFIRNEYGEKVSIADMEMTITARLWHGEFPRRHDIDGRHCIGHGDGTWDYVTGEFS